MKKFETTPGTDANGRATVTIEDLDTGVKAVLSFAQYLTFTDYLVAGGREYAASYLGRVANGTATSSV